MEDLRKEDSEEQLKEFGQQENPLNTSVEGIAEDQTTGSGYTEADRAAKDSTNAEHPDDTQNKGSRQLIDQYDINDQAHSNSSVDDFVQTISKSRHLNGTDGSAKNTEG